MDTINAVKWPIKYLSFMRVFIGLNADHFFNADSGVQ
jgi:hypothetical protein